MTQEQKRIKLAEAAGIQVKKFRYQIPYHGNTSIWRKGFLSEQDAIISREQDKPWVESEVEPYNDLFACPDYFKDLNAVHELENIIKDRPKWIKMLAKVIAGVPDATRAGGTKVFVDNSILARATAAERCEAIGKTLGLW